MRPPVAQALGLAFAALVVGCSAPEAYHGGAARMGAGGQPGQVNVVGANPGASPSPSPAGVDGVASAPAGDAATSDVVASVAPTVVAADARTIADEAFDHEDAPRGGEAETRADATALSDRADAAAPEASVDAVRETPPEVADGGSASDVHLEDMASADDGAADAAGPVRINCGGPAATPFEADRDFMHGAPANHAVAISLGSAVDPAPIAVYQTARGGTFTYDLDGFRPGSTHLIRLHFAETYFSAAGRRVCNITANGAAFLTNYDIFAAAGAMSTVNIQEGSFSASGSGAWTSCRSSTAASSRASRSAEHGPHVSGVLPREDLTESSLSAMRAHARGVRGDVQYLRDFARHELFVAQEAAHQTVVARQRRNRRVHDAGELLLLEEPVSGRQRIAKQIPLLTRQPLPFASHLPPVIDVEPPRDRVRPANDGRAETIVASVRVQTHQRFVRQIFGEGAIAARPKQKGYETRRRTIVDLGEGSVVAARVAGHGGVEAVRR
jgi:hypothetical protein